ncbi:MAG: GNAT family N-acetyltransferase [Anaerolineales bacterium]|jgi:dTDP-4-amino-4,6-dideoxy-D-galactose acyltransferase
MVANPELCSILEWDSAFFGVTIARVNRNRLEVETVAQIMDWCREKKVSCLYFLADSNHVETLRLAEKNGFYLTDIRVTYEHSLRGMGEQHESVPNIRLAVPQDLPVLRAMTDSSYRDSRFYYDGHFPEEACNRLYEIWIEKSLSGYAEAVLVMGEPGQPEGFVTCNTSLPEAIGKIGLVGVSRSSRGQGVGKALMLESLHWFTAHGMAFAQVATQGRNISAQRLYQRCGFLTKEVRFWYHRWFGEK